MTLVAGEPKEKDGVATGVDAGGAAKEKAGLTDDVGTGAALPARSILLEASTALVEFPNGSTGAPKPPGVEPGAPGFVPNNDAEPPETGLALEEAGLEVGPPKLNAPVALGGSDLGVDEPVMLPKGLLEDIDVGVEASFGGAPKALKVLVAEINADAASIG